LWYIQRMSPHPKPRETFGARCRALALGGRRSRHAVVGVGRRNSIA
jgi:hypothetical protein